MKQGEWQRRLAIFLVGAGCLAGVASRAAAQRPEPPMARVEGSELLLSATVKHADTTGVAHVTVAPPVKSELGSANKGFDVPFDVAHGRFTATVNLSSMDRGNEQPELVILTLTIDSWTPLAKLQWTATVPPASGPSSTQKSAAAAELEAMQSAASSSAEAAYGARGPGALPPATTPSEPAPTPAPNNASTGSTWFSFAGLASDYNMVGIIACALALVALLLALFRSPQQIVTEAPTDPFLAQEMAALGKRVSELAKHPDQLNLPAGTADDGALAREVAEVRSRLEHLEQQQRPVDGGGEELASGLGLLQARLHRVEAEHEAAHALAPEVAGVAGRIQQIEAKHEAALQALDEASTAARAEHASILERLQAVEARDAEMDGLRHQAAAAGERLERLEAAQQPAQQRHAELRDEVGSLAGRMHHAEHQMQIIEALEQGFGGLAGRLDHLEFLNATASESASQPAPVVPASGGPAHEDVSALAARLERLEPVVGWIQGLEPHLRRQGTQLDELSEAVAALRSKPEPTGQDVVERLQAELEQQKAEQGRVQEEAARVSAQVAEHVAETRAALQELTSRLASAGVASNTLPQTPAAAGHAVSRADDFRPPAWRRALRRASELASSEPFVTDVPSQELYVERVRNLRNAMAAAMPEQPVSIVHVKKDIFTSTVELHETESRTNGDVVCLICRTRQTWQLAVVAGRPRIDDVFLFFPGGTLGKEFFSAGYLALVEGLQAGSFSTNAYEPAELMLEDAATSTYAVLHKLRLLTA